MTLPEEDLRAAGAPRPRRGVENPGTFTFTSRRTAFTMAQAASQPVVGPVFRGTPLVGMWTPSR